MSTLADSSHLTQRGQAAHSSDGDSLSPSSSSARFASALDGRQFEKHSYAPSGNGLLDHHQLPRWIQVIDSTPGWVRSYHRPPQPSVSACLASVFQWNTETVNIWSHLLAFMGAVYFLYDFVTNQFFFNTRDYGFSFEDLSSTDRVVMLTFVWSSLAIFSISTIFHTFICHSPGVSDKLRRLDHVAAVNHIACGMYPVVYSALTCSPYRWHYMWAIAISSVVCMFAFYFGDIYEPEKAWIRGVMALTVAGTATAGLVHHGTYLGADGIWQAMGGIWLIRMMTCNFLSFSFYVAHFPERWWPGKFDLVGHSHQLLHVVATVATLCQCYAILSSFGYTLHSPCVM